MIILADESGTARITARGILVLLLVMCFPFLTMSNREEVKAAAVNDRNQSVDEISKELSNPVSSLYIFPFEYDFDGDVGPNYGKRNTLNIQPVIPVNLGKDWKVIIRTIIPLIQQNDIYGDTSQKGVGDIEQSFFFAPQSSSSQGANKLIWGVGPIVIFHWAMMISALKSGLLDLLLRLWYRQKTGLSEVLQSNYGQQAVKVTEILTKHQFSHLWLII